MAGKCIYTPKTGIINLVETLECPEIKDFKHFTGWRIPYFSQLHIHIYHQKFIFIHINNYPIHCICISKATYPIQYVYTICMFIFALNWVISNLYQWIV